MGRCPSRTVSHPSRAIDLCRPDGEGTRYARGTGNHHSRRPATLACAPRIEGSSAVCGCHVSTFIGARGRKQSCSCSQPARHANAVGSDNHATTLVEKRSAKSRLDCAKRQCGVSIYAQKRRKEWGTIIVRSKLMSVLNGSRERSVQRPGMVMERPITAKGLCLVVGLREPGYCK